MCVFDRVALTLSATTSNLNSATKYAEYGLDFSLSSDSDDILFNKGISMVKNGLTSEGTRVLRFATNYTEYGTGDKLPDITNLEPQRMVCPLRSLKL